MGRLASELDILMVTVEEQANEPNTVSATSEKPTDQPANSVATG